MKQPELGKKIANLRNEKGLTQEELVDRCNISVRTIQRIESGEVTPRNYTLRIIMEALEEDPGLLRNANPVSVRSLSQMQFAWIAGILYFVLAIPEGLLDYGRWEDGWGVAAGSLSFYEISYLVIKLLVGISFFYFMRGFISLGEYLADDLLRIAAHLLVGLTILMISLDIASLYLDILSDGIYLYPVSICFGILGIIFGIALFRRRSRLGTVAALAGAMEISAGICFLFFVPLGLFILALAEIFEIIALYRGWDQATKGESFEDDRRFMTEGVGL